MAQSGENSLTRVKCDDPKASFVVVGRVNDRDEIEASLSACDPFTDKGAAQAYWEGKDGGKGFVLCLAKK